jgi:hypothetical protein
MELKNSNPTTSSKCTTLMMLTTPNSAGNRSTRFVKLALPSTFLTIATSTRTHSESELTTHVVMDNTHSLSESNLLQCPCKCSLFPSLSKDVLYSWSGLNPRTEDLPSLITLFVYATPETHQEVACQLTRFALKTASMPTKVASSP